MKNGVLLVGLVGILLAACGEYAPPASTAGGTGGAGAAGAGGMGTGGTGGSGTGGMGTGGMGTGGMGGGPGVTCGDGNVDYLMGEQCDDGNKVSGDGCSAACAIEAAPTCGNGVLDIAAGEECDDGNKAAGDGCSPACQLELVGQVGCGNGMLAAPEVCDDGNTTNGDGCNPTCNLRGESSLFVGMPGQGGAVDGVGTLARLSGAAVLTVDAKNLYLAEEAGRVVRSIDIATKTVKTIAGVAGAPQAYVDAPIGVNARFGSLEAIATDGTTIWIADAFNHVIRAVSVAAPNGVTTVAGTGVAGMAQDGIGAAAQFDGIRGLTYYKGLVYLLDPTAAVLRSFNPVTTEVKTLAGTPYVTGTVDGIGAAARFTSPRYMTSDGSGMLYIADTNGNAIRAYNTVTGEVSTFAGDGSCGYIDATGNAARVHRPRGMASDGASVYWVEFNAHTIRQGVVATHAVGTLSGTPAACAIDCSCNPPPAGAYAEGIGAAAAWNGPFSIAFHWPTNSLFVVDGGNFVLRRIQ